MKFYGRVIKIIANKDGILYAKLDDLNKDGEQITICAGKDKKKFGGVELKEGLRIAGQGTEASNGSCLVKGKIKAYVEKPSGDIKMVPMVLGNAINVAHALLVDSIKGGINDYELVYQTAKEIYTKAVEIRKSHAEKYPERSDRDLGMKWGDILKRAAEVSLDVDSCLEKAQQMMDAQIKLEDEMIKELSS